MEKPYIGDDNLLKAIDAAQMYQPVPPELFKGKRRNEYFVWRNTQVPRTVADRDALVSLHGKAILDIGCNIGYFGWKNAEHITRYMGVDSDSVCIKVAQMIAKELGCKDLWFSNVDLVKSVGQIKSRYDTCLFFSVYHHLLYQIGMEKARKVIKEISTLCSELYFDMGQKDESTNLARSKWHDLLPDEAPEQFIKKEVLKNTLFKFVEILGETKVGNSGRLLFRFTK